MPSPKPVFPAYGGHCGYAGSFCTSAAQDGYCSAHHCTYMSHSLKQHICQSNQHLCTEADASGQCRHPACIRKTHG